MRRLPITRIVLLVLLVGFGSLAMLSSWGPAVHAQGERQKQEALSSTLALLAMTLAKDPEVSGILGAAFGAGVEIGQFVNMVVAELQARPDLSSLQDLYNVLADQEKFTPLIREVFKAAIANNGGDVTKVVSQIDAFTPNIQGFQITALEQIPDASFDSEVKGFLRTIDPSPTEDTYWDSQVDPFVDRMRTNMLGDAAFEDVAILARTIGAYTGKTTQEVLDGQVDEAAIAAISGVSEQFKQFLNAMLRRVRSLRLASLAQQVDRLTTELAQTNRQLNTIQGELEELKGRRDPLPLVLAIVALVLAAGALGLTVLRRRAT